MKTMAIMAGLTVAMLGLSGCATLDTPYQPTGIRGGYSHEKLGDNDYRVVFGGNGYSTDAQAEDFAFLRAAELCRDQGRSHMRITERSLRHEELSYYAPNTYSMDTIGEAPVATIRVTCTDTPGETTLAVADLIRDIRARNVENLPR